MPLPNNILEKIFVHSLLQDLVTNQVVRSVKLVNENIRTL